MLPRPEPGLVIRYSYLWRREHLEGRQEGLKDRPCAIVAAIRAGPAGDTRVLVLPITHTAPDAETPAIEIPLAVKSRLGLDTARSWVVLSEWNEFIWPGPDLRPVPGGDPASVAYGMLPPRLFVEIRDALLQLIEASAAKPVPRT